MPPTRAARTKAQYANQRLDRSAADALELITEVVGIYSTAPTSHLALIARLDGHRPGALDKLLFDDRSLVRMGAMRGSGYYIPTKLVPIVVRATDVRDRVFRGIVGKLMDRRTYERLAAKIEKVLAGCEMTTAEIGKAVKDPRYGKHLRYVVQLMSTECRIVTTRTSGTWRSNLTYNALWSDWLPKVDPWKVPPEKAKADLAKLYFAAHGPATIEDFAWWSGLKKDAASVMAAAKVPELGDGYFGVIGGEGAAAKGVRLLPIWDSAFLTHKDRSHVVGDDLYRHVYDASGNPTSIVMVNGTAAGQWDLTIDKSHHQVKVAPFESFSDATWKGIDKEVDRLAVALGAPDVEVRRVKKAPSIADAGWNRFMSPLKGL